MENYIFDVDLTLIDSHKVNLLSTQSAFRQMGWPAPSSADILKYTGMSIDRSFPKMAPANAKPADFQKLFPIFVDKYKKLKNNNIKLFDGMADILKTLSERGKNLFIVTSNSHAIVLDNFKILGIAQYFKEIVGSEDVEHSKPYPDGDLKIVHDNHLDPDQTIMIGDATYDLKMGKNAGVHTAGVTWGAHPKSLLASVHPDYLIDHPKDLLNIK
ncbi:phosphatase [Philodulcilactobacillus myokoensis]|uniref:Phosphatase n=1 Tax=Philodulcilactobacillus myokoensis TaxID=2929573 RepID=A0A9W6B043_9LACO|nr:HAD family hydrolase [Philodulcilactobacillus myokoensis]GLB46331.1 phosphatase [Philodulcilactobacillus myokoensis]